MYLIHPNEQNGSNIKRRVVNRSYTKAKVQNEQCGSFATEKTYFDHLILPLSTNNSATFTSNLAPRID